MNVAEGLQTIRYRLEARDADAQTLALVDQILRRASLPAAKPAAAQSLVQLVRMLARTPIADGNIRIYNDLVGLEEELSNAGAAMRARAEAEEAKPVPKTKKFYKEKKDREARS